MVAYVPMKHRQGYDVTDHMTTHMPPTNQTALSSGPSEDQTPPKVNYNLLTSQGPRSMGQSLDKMIKIHKLAPSTQMQGTYKK